VKTVADRYRHAAQLLQQALITGLFDLSTSMTMNDLEPPKERSFDKFFAISVCDRHLRVNCTKMAGDRPRQPACKIFSIKRRFQESKSRPTRFKEACAGVRQKRLPPKMVIFTAIGLFSVKTDADRHRQTAYHYKH